MVMRRPTRPNHPENGQRDGAMLGAPELGDIERAVQLSATED